MSLDIDQKKSILDFVVRFPEVVKSEKWVSSYDIDTDAMAIRSPKLSFGARKRYFSDEFAFYINNKNEVEGVFIEYFMTNFMSHHKDLKQFKRDIAKEIKENKPEGSAVIKFETRETKRMVPEIGDLIISSLLPA